MEKNLPNADAILTRRARRVTNSRNKNLTQEDNTYVPDSAINTCFVNMRVIRSIKSWIREVSKGNQQHKATKEKPVFPRLSRKEDTRALSTPTLHRRSVRR